MPLPEEKIESVRSFNRFYTKQVGLLREGLLKTPYSLTQARVLYELGQHPGTRSSSLAEDLGLDSGYLSRLLKKFEVDGLIERSPSAGDRRANDVSLTTRGSSEFKKLDARSRVEAGEMLARIDPEDQERLIDSMTMIQHILDPEKKEKEAFTIRTHRPGDIGWVIARHGKLYAQEYGWDTTFEGLVAEIAGQFLKSFDAERERCWIAEDHGQRLGSIFLVKDSLSTARLRLLLVEPAARGMGVGTRLVEECLAFAHQAGYRKITLWTNAILHAARRIYERAGFSLVKEETHFSFGHPLVGQYWELKFD